MKKQLVTHHWLAGKSLYRHIPDPIVSEHTEVAVCFFDISHYNQVLGYMVFDNPLDNFMTQITFDIPHANGELEEILAFTVSKEKVKARIINKEFNKRTLTSTEIGDEESTNKIVYDKIVSELNKCKWPYVESVGKINKLIVPEKLRCEFKFLDMIAIDHDETIGKTYILDKHPQFPNILYTINIIVNNNKTRSVYLLHYNTKTPNRYDNNQAFNLVYITLKEKYIHQFRIEVTNTLGQVIESQGSISLHFVSQ